MNQDLKILIVNDNLISQKLAVKLISKLGLKVAQAFSGYANACYGLTRIRKKNSKFFPSKRLDRNKLYGIIERLSK